MWPSYLVGSILRVYSLTLLAVRIATKSKSILIEVTYITAISDANLISTLSGKLSGLVTNSMWICMNLGLTLYIHYSRGFPSVNEFWVSTEYHFLPLA